MSGQIYRAIVKRQYCIVTVENM